MEGVPRMPMLSIDSKLCVASAEFGPKIKQYIALYYKEDPEKYDKAVEELDSLREHACKAAADVSGCKILKKYFAQLHMLRSRFPMEQGDEAAVAFSWFDKFCDMPNPVTVEDIRFEMACVMHNVGAVHSSIGAGDNRMSAEGMKSSCTHFQCAAWAFQYMRDKISCSTFTADFDKSLLSWYSSLMLAQAQECILEKSMVDNRKNSIVAKVAMQVAEFYKQCLSNMEIGTVTELISSSKYKSWQKFCQIKQTYYTAIACLYMGQNADEQQKMGERLAWFDAGAEKMADATKLGQKETSVVTQALKFTSDVVTVKKDNAKKENDFIFHEKIPELSSLPEIKGVPLVKGIEFSPLDPEISGPDIFGALVPFSVHETNSLYSEEKAKLLRSVVERVEEKNLELESFMKSLHLEKLPVSKEINDFPLPETLLERSALFNDECDAVPKLLDAQQRLTGCYQEADKKLLDLQQRVSCVEKEVSAVHDKLPENKREHLKRLLERLRELKPEIDQFCQAHFRATESNKELQKAVAVHSENLKILAAPLPELKRCLPVPPVQIATAPESLELKRLLDKVEEMKSQRKLLMDMFRDQILKDDLTKLIISEKDTEPQTLFLKELKKHDEKVSLLDQNLAAQANILKALTETNAKYADLRQQTTEAIHARETKVLSLIAAYDVYVDVKDKAEKGRQFYEKLLIGLNNFDDKIDSLESDWQLAKETLKKEFREKEKQIAEQTLQTEYSPGTVGQKTSRPRLQDYMEYYRGRKAAADSYQLPCPSTVQGGYSHTVAGVSSALISAGGLSPVKQSGTQIQGMQFGYSAPSQNPPSVSPQQAIVSPAAPASFMSSGVPSVIPASPYSSLGSPYSTGYSTVAHCVPQAAQSPVICSTSQSSQASLLHQMTGPSPSPNVQPTSHLAHPQPAGRLPTPLPSASAQRFPYAQAGYIHHPSGVAVQQKQIGPVSNFIACPNIPHHAAGVGGYYQPGAQTSYYVPQQPAASYPPTQPQPQPTQPHGTSQCFAGIDTPVLGTSLPAPLQPSRIPEKPPAKQLTQTEKELADVFG